MKEIHKQILIGVCLALGLATAFLYSYNTSRTYCHRIPEYEYSFEVDGTTNTLIYTIYDDRHHLVGTVQANQLDSLINADNE